MLKALTRSKTGRTSRDLLMGRAGVVHYEDPLTSTVFERLSYLPRRLAWSLLAEAVGWTLNERPWPKTPPPGPTQWHFWPSYPSPDPEGTRIAPDVVWSFADGTTVIIEAKHHDAQHLGQWEREIRAVRAHTDGRRLLFLAVGDSVPRLDRSGAKRLRTAGAHRAGHIAWPDLASAVRAVDRGPRHTGRLIEDIQAALRLWGYPPRAWFGSLPSCLPEEPFERALPALGGSAGASGPLPDLFPTRFLRPDALDRWRPTR